MSAFIDQERKHFAVDLLCRTWRSRSRLELAIVEWVGWYNGRRLHESLDEVPPVEFEDAYRAALAATPTPTVIN